MDSNNKTLDDQVKDLQEKLGYQYEEMCDVKNMLNTRDEDMTKKFDDLQKHINDLQRQVKEIESISRQTKNKQQRKEYRPSVVKVGKLGTSTENLENELCTFMYNSAESMVREKSRDRKADETGQAGKFTRRAAKVTEKPSWHY